MSVKYEVEPFADSISSKSEGMVQRILSPVKCPTFERDKNQVLVGFKNFKPRLNEDLALRERLTLYYADEVVQKRVHEKMDQVYQNHED